jgi:hypothetical protein
MEDLHAGQPQDAAAPYEPAAGQTAVVGAA